MSSKEMKPRFVPRESPLTIGLRDPNHQATFSLFMAANIVVTVVIAVRYFIRQDIMLEDVDFLMRGFGNLHVFIIMEALFTLLFAFALLPATVSWMRQGIGSTYYAIIVTVIACVIVITPVYCCLVYPIHPIMRTAFVLEQIRILMKLVSFVAENVGQNERGGTAYERDKKDCYENKSSKQAHSDEFPSLRSTIYFLFAPTLMYQHSYPRSRGPIRWCKAFINLASLFITAPVCLAIIHQISAICNTIGKQEMTTDTLIELTCWCLAFGCLFLSILGYNFFHCYLNGWAELMRFGDRQFYKNWWSASHIFVFLRLWNHVVHRWIMSYVHEPVRHYAGNRILTLYAVLFMSGFMHDYVLSFVFGFAAPFFFLSIMIQLPLIPIFLFLNKYAHRIPLPRTNMNIFFVYILMFSNATMYCSMEFFARVNCPHSHSSSVFVIFFSMRTTLLLILISQIQHSRTGLIILYHEYGHDFNKLTSPSAINIVHEKKKQNSLF